MAIKTLSRFKSRLNGGGARPNLFEANINFPNDLSTPAGVKSNWLTGAQEDFQFFCKATSMPAATIGVVDVPFRGRILKVAGDRTFEPWTVTVINDEDFNVRKSFELWAEGINSLVSGVGEVDPTVYMGQGHIRQLSRSQTVAGDESTTQPGVQKATHVYQVHDIWPSEISSIDLSYDSSDAIEEFTVTFQVEYITSNGVSTGGDGDTNQQSEAGEPAAGAAAATVTGTGAATAAGV